MKRLILVFLIFVCTHIFGQQINRQYIVGSDPVNIFALPQDDEEMRKYVGQEPVYAITNSGSGKKAVVQLNPGFIFYNKIKDGERDSIREFTIAWCGNDSRVYQLIGIQGKVLKHIPVDKTLLIKRNTSDSDLQLLEYLKEQNAKTEALAEYISDLSDTLREVNIRTKKIESDVSILKKMREQEKKDKKYFLTIVKIFVVVAGIIVGYFVITNNTRPTTIINISQNPPQNLPQPPGGPGPDPPN